MVVMPRMQSTGLGAGKAASPLPLRKRTEAAGKGARPSLQARLLYACFLNSGLLGLLGEAAWVQLSWNVEFPRLVPVSF